MDPFDAAVRELSSPDDYQLLNSGQWLCQRVTAFGWVVGIGDDKNEALAAAMEKGQSIEDEWVAEVEARARKQA